MKRPLRLVLPDFVTEREVTVGCSFQAGHGAQAGRLARAGMAEQGGDAAARQGQIDVEFEIVAVRTRNLARISTLITFSAAPG
jgi:hypothetical protein